MFLTFTIECGTLKISYQWVPTLRPFDSSWSAASMALSSLVSTWLICSRIFAFFLWQTRKTYSAFLALTLLVCLTSTNERTVFFTSLLARLTWYRFSPHFWVSTYTCSSVDNYNTLPTAMASAHLDNVKVRWQYTNFAADLHSSERATTHFVKLPQKDCLRSPSTWFRLLDGTVTKDMDWISTGYRQDIGNFLGRLHRISTLTVRRLSNLSDLLKIYNTQQLILHPSKIIWRMQS